MEHLKGFSFRTSNILSTLINSQASNESQICRKKSHIHTEISASLGQHEKLDLYVSQLLQRWRYSSLSILSHSPFGIKFRIFFETTTHNRAAGPNRIPGKLPASKYANDVYSICKCMEYLSHYGLFQVTMKKLLLKEKSFRARRRSSLPRTWSFELFLRFNSRKNHRKWFMPLCDMR